MSKKALMWFVCVALTASFVGELWVGPLTIYHESSVAIGEAIHQGILANTPPEGFERWGDAGAQGSELRVLLVFAVDAVARAIGVEVGYLYRIVALVSLFTVLTLLPIYLLRWFEPATAAIGQLLFVAVQPLSYLFHTFHPWDRPSLLAWMFALFLVRDRRVWLLAAWLVVAIPIKYDIVALPGLYFLAFADRGNFWRVSVTTMALTLVAFADFAVLLSVFGAGERRDVMALVGSNVSLMLQTGVKNPTLLAFGLPAGWALAGLFAMRKCGLPRPDRFILASFGFGVGLLLLFFLLTNFHEYRAQNMVTILFLPLALYAFEAFVKPVPLSDQQHLATAGEGT